MKFSATLTAKLLILLLVVTTFAFLLRWYHSLEWIETTEIIPSRAMKTDPTLVTKVWLEHTQRKVKTLNRIKHNTDILLENTDAVIMWGNINYLTPTQHQQLINFIHSGGTLMFAVPDHRIQTFEVFPLLAELGIVAVIPGNRNDNHQSKKSIEHTLKERHKAIENLLDKTNARHIGLESFNRCRQSTDNAVHSITLPTGKAWMCLNQTTPFSLTERRRAKEIIATRTNTDHLLMARFAVGDGSVIVFSSLDHFWNHGDYTLDDFDHAWWLNKLLGESKRIMLIHHHQAPSLWVLIKHYLPYSIACLLFCAIFWVMHLLPRFGPIEVAPSPFSQAFGDHLHASAHILRRYRKIDWIIHHYFELMCRRFPSLHHLPIQQKLVELSQLTGLDANELSKIINPRVPYHQRVQQLQQLRKSL